MAQRTRIAAQLRWHLHELDPDFVVPSRGLRRPGVVDGVRDHLDRFTRTVARLARRLLGRCSDLNTEIAELEAELRHLTMRLAPALLQVPGCGVMTAALIVGEVAGIDRFRDKNAFARFTGTAPVPVWSGASAGKVRLNRGGNRAMNYALHTIAVTQTRRGVGPGSDYVDKQRERGKDTTAALRLLRRRLSDVVYQALRSDLDLRHAEWVGLTT